MIVANPHATWKEHLQVCGVHEKKNKTLLINAINWIDLKQHIFLKKINAVDDYRSV